VTVASWAWGLTNVEADPPYNRMEGLRNMAGRRWFKAGFTLLRVDVPASDVPMDWYWYSAPGEPGISYWPVRPLENLVWEVGLYVSQALTGCYLFAQAQRVDASGQFIANASAPEEVLLDTPGVVSVVMGAGLEQAAAYGDRVRLLMRFHRASKSAGAVVLWLRNEATTFLRSPLPMANPKIVYDGKTLSFPQPLSAYRLRPRTGRILSWSEASVAATRTHSAWDEAEIEVARFAEESFYNDLRAWWSWARRGKQYAFALDSSEVQDALSSAASVAGGGAIYVSNTSGFVQGKPYVVRRADGMAEEIIVPTSISTNASLNLAPATLKFDYPAASIVRSPDYFPKVVSLDDELPCAREVTTWTLAHKFREDKG
jgi:hypothetical protein